MQPADASWQDTKTHTDITKQAPASPWQQGKSAKTPVSSVSVNLLNVVSSGWLMPELNRYSASHSYHPKPIWTGWESGGTGFCTGSLGIQSERYHLAQFSQTVLDTVPLQSHFMWCHPINRSIWQHIENLCRTQMAYKWSQLHKDSAPTTQLLVCSQYAFLFHLVNQSNIQLQITGIGEERNKLYDRFSNIPDSYLYVEQL
jgi:hypothetical protein